MSEDASTTTTETTPKVTEPAKSDDVPADVLRKLLDEARNEAAENRVKGKKKVEETKAEVTQQFEAKLAEANSAHEATKVKLAESQLTVEKLTVAIKAGFEKDDILEVADLLKGSTNEELTAHAARLKGLFGTKGETPPAVDPTAGAGNSGDNIPLNGDPLMRALTSKLGIR